MTQVQTNLDWQAMDDAPARPATLLTRDDTFFGVCQGVGEDFGFNPNWLRVAFALALFFNPVGSLVAYAVLGVTVLLSRLLFPAGAAATTAVEAPVTARQPAPMPLAA